MAASFPPEIMAKVKEVTSMCYADQAVFFLNAFYGELTEENRELIWKLNEQFEKEDHVKGKKGNELNPIQAFNLLQRNNQTLTALELKAMLRKVDIDANGEMALAEYVINFFSKSVIEFAENPQGSVDPELLAAAKAKLAELNETFEKLLVAQENAKKAAEAAAAAQAEAERAEAEVIQLKKEAEEIQAEIKREEDAKAAEIARLEALSTDQSVGIVKRNMAVQQLATAKNEDPLPLRKAKLTQDAVVRKLERAVKAAAEATAAAVEAKKRSDEAVVEVENQIAVCQQQLAEAEAQLKKLMASGDGAMGLDWWMKRTITEKKKYLPQSRQ